MKEGVFHNSPIATFRDRDRIFRNSLYLPETKEIGAFNVADIVFIRHGQRGLENGKTYLTDIGRRQARKTGERLIQHGICIDEYDSVSVQSSYSGDIDPVTMLPRSAETAQIIARELGISELQNKPSRLERVELEEPIYPSHYDHNRVLNNYLPTNYKELGDEERLKAEQEALTKTVDTATVVGTQEASAYRRDIAGALAFTLLTELDRIQKEKSKTKSLTLIGSHSTFFEWLLKETLVREVSGGSRQVGYRNLQEIGGPLNYAEAVRIRLATGSQGNAHALEVTFFDPRRPLQKGLLDEERLIELASTYVQSREGEQDSQKIKI